MQFNTIVKKVSVAVFVAMLSVAGNVQSSRAQFSQSVVMLKGTVRNAENGNPLAVNVSIRSASDTSIEVTSSRSNSASGSYLVILKPASKYMVHIEGDSVIAQNMMIETPEGTKSTQMLQDFSVPTMQNGTVSASTSMSALTVVEASK